MDLPGLLPLLRNLAPYQQLLSEGSAEAQSLLESARAFVAAGLAQDRPGPLLILTARNEGVQKWVERLPSFLPATGAAPIHIFAEPDSLPYERIRWTDRTRQQRLTALAALQSRSGPAPIVVASACGLLQKTLPGKELRLALRTLSVGSFVNLEELTGRWAHSGYEPVQVVEEPGTFARRGGIVDIWPPNLPHPVRIDLFGDEVESLRIFDPATQRSESRVERIEIGPGSEALSKYGPKVLERLAEDNRPQTTDEALLNSQFATRNASILDDPRLLLAIREEIRLETDALAESRSFRGIEWYLPYFYSRPASLLDHLPDNTTVLVDDGAALVSELLETERRNGQIREELQRSGELPTGFASSFFPAAEIVENLQARSPILLGFGNLDGSAQSANTPLARAFAPGPSFGGETKRILREVQKYTESGHSVVMITRQAARLQEELTSAGIPVHLRADLETPPQLGVTLLQGTLNDGFTLRRDRGSGTGERAV